MSFENCNKLMADTAVLSQWGLFTFLCFGNKFYELTLFSNYLYNIKKSLPQMASLEPKIHVMNFLNIKLIMTSKH